MLLLKHLRNPLSANHFQTFFLAFFFIYFADAIMSYFFPVAVELTVNSNTVLGIVMAMSSVVSIICDLTFPQLLNGKTWKSLFTSGILIAFTFPIFITLGYKNDSVLFFILGAIVWGLYYELISFAMQNYIVTTGNPKSYSSLWGIASLIMSVCFIVGPIVGSQLFENQIELFLIVILLLQAIAFGLTFLLLDKNPSMNKKIEVANNLEIIEPIKPPKGLKPFFSLGSRIYSVLILDTALSIITSSFWTIGGLFGLQLFQGSGADWLVIVVFSAPMLVGSYLVYRFNIHKHKKRYATLLLLAAGIFLLGIKLFQDTTILVLASIILSSLCLSFAFPLDQAIFSDLQKRTARFKFYVASLDNLGNSIAYVVGPIIAGLFADNLGYFNTFGALGIFSILIALFLLVITPRKLKIPQKELSSI